MKTPSIESIFIRKEEKSYPIAKHFHDARFVGGVARAWVRKTRGENTQSLWASLPPLAA